MMTDYDLSAIIACDCINHDVTKDTVYLGTVLHWNMYCKFFELAKDPYGEGSQKYLQCRAFRGR